MSARPSLADATITLTDTIESKESAMTTLALSRSALTRAAVALAASLVLAAPARAHGGPSDASAALSAVPVAVSVVAPAAVLSAGAVLTVVAVESTARGTVWVLKRASDGVKVSVEFAGKVVGGAALSVGTAVTVSAIGTGMVLSAAGEAIAFIPNEIGASLLHNERLTPAAARAEKVSR